MKRPDRIFGHRLLMTPVASYIGLAAMAYGTHALITGVASLWWLAPMLFFTFWMLMGVTVGMHRLFCHQAFKTSWFWQWMLGIFGTLAIYGSTIQWPSMHMSHHQFSDTDRDPHYTGWQYLFWKKNRPTTFNRRVLVRLRKDPMHAFLHDYYVLIPLAATIGLSLISLNALVFCYLIPLGWLHLVGSAHQVFAHKDGPRDQEWLEYILPTGGEWLHRHHHDAPKDIKFGRSDIGYHLIRAIADRH